MLLTQYFDVVINPNPQRPNPKAITAATAIIYKDPLLLAENISRS
jgi:hypothetical protein